MTKAQARVKSMLEEEETNSKRLLAKAAGISLSKRVHVKSREGRVDVTGLPELNS